MLVRKAVSEDLQELVSLFAALWPDVSSDEHRAEAEAILDGHPRSTEPLTVFVANEGDRSIGFVEVGLRSHADGCDAIRPCGFVEGWYVTPDRRGSGVGRALMEQAEAWVRTMGCTELASDTWIDSLGSERAHVALGFEVVDRCVHFRKALGVTEYGSDLALIHHRHFGNLARAAAADLLFHLSERGIDHGTVVDLGTGSGILAGRLSQAGFSAWGVDLSDDMLRIARAEAPKATFVQGSLWEVELPPCVAVSAAGEALNYANASTSSRPALDTRFRAIHRALASRGLLMFDLASPGRAGRRRSRHVSETLGGTYLAMTEREDDRRLTRSITLFVSEGDRYRRIDETHVLWLYTADEIEAALTAAGFTWKRLQGYGLFTLPPGHSAYLAVKA